MIKPWQFIKEHEEQIIKSLIDKFIFGLIATFIVIGVQKCSDQNTRIQIKKEAIFQLESSFILNEAKTFQNLFSRYILIVERIISFPTEKNIKPLSPLEEEIKTSLGIISSLYGVGHEQVKSFRDFIKATELLDQMLKEKSNDAEVKKKIKIQLKSIKEVLYKDVLVAVREAAIETLLEKDN